MKKLKIYLAAPYSSRAELLPVAAKIEAMGHTITSSWLDEPPEWTGPESVTEEQTRDIIDQDLQDVRDCDMLIAITPKALKTPVVKNSGGRHVEFGYAMALGKELVVVGEKENIFHHFQNYRCDIETMLEELQHPAEF